MLCPVCDVELAMAERKGIEIDYCPQCRGVWLDRGELDRIIDRTDYQRAKKNKYDPDYRTTYRGHEDSSYKKRNRYKKRRVKSVVEEIFDLFD
ncbi:MAG: zf-TFIIB domain-containing protein [Chloroflexota bacterium]